MSCMLRLFFPGVFITSDPEIFVVGDKNTVTCFSDAGVADRIQWFSGDEGLLDSGTFLEELNLVFDPVSDSLHQTSITCAVTKETVARKTLGISVRGECALL